MPVIVADGDVATLRSEGFVVLRRALDVERLSHEVDVALADGCRDAPMNTGTAGNSFRYVPMMCERTPVSLSLVDDLVAPAARLLDRAVIPVRAKGTRYHGATAWHRDSELDIATLGFAAYLEPLADDDGALRVLPGSHRRRTTEPPSGLPETGSVVGRTVETEPGDVIVFDERLWHASAGGAERRQWRVDFLPDPVSPEEDARIRAYLALTFEPGWDGGYDVDRYPSYGAHWAASGRPWVDRLLDLGAVERAEQQESAVRAKRQA